MEQWQGGGEGVRRRKQQQVDFECLELPNQSSEMVTVKLPLASTPEDSNEPWATSQWGSFLYTMQSDPRGLICEWTSQHQVREMIVFAAKQAGPCNILFFVSPFLLFLETRVFRERHIHSLPFGQKEKCILFGLK